MTLQNPWMLTALGTLALPIVIHLLSRTQAVVQKFPSLRFLDVSRLLPTRSPRITDVPLLLVRMAIFAAAVVAPAAPLLNTAARPRRVTASVARAIVVDTSASVVGATAGEVDSVMAQARQLTGDAEANTVLRTANVAAGIAQASDWLSAQGGRGEVVVVSDFQTSTIDSAALAAIPRQYGVNLVRALAKSTAPVRNSAAANVMMSQATRVVITTEPTRTVADWSPDTTQSHAGTVVLFAPTAQRSDADAIADVAMQVAAPPKADASIAIAIVFAGAPELAAIEKTAKPMSQPWMGAFIQRLVSDARLAQAMDEAPSGADTTMVAPWFVVGRNARGSALVFAAAATVASRARVVLFTKLQPSTVAAAQLISAVQASSALSWNASEHETRALSDAALAALSRPPGSAPVESAPPDDHTLSGESDARWFWAIALALLALEASMRRDQRLAPAVQNSTVNAG